jgi:hypothetical protein
VDNINPPKKLYTISRYKTATYNMSQTVGRLGVEEEQEQVSQVRRFLNAIKGKKLNCISCGHKVDFTNLAWNPHDGCTHGLLDSSGKRWWMYIECPNPECGYGWAYWKVFQQVRKDERLTKEEAFDLLEEEMYEEDDE